MPNLTVRICSPSWFAFKKHHLTLGQALQWMSLCWVSFQKVPLGFNVNVHTVHMCCNKKPVREPLSTGQPTPSPTQLTSNKSGLMNKAYEPLVSLIKAGHFTSIPGGGRITWLRSPDVRCASKSCWCGWNVKVGGLFVSRRCSSMVSTPWKVSMIRQVPVILSETKNKTWLDHIFFHPLVTVSLFRLSWCLFLPESYKNWLAGVAFIGS